MRRLFIATLFIVVAAYSVQVFGTHPSIWFTDSTLDTLQARYARNGDAMSDLFTFCATNKTICMQRDLDVWRAGSHRLVYPPNMVNYALAYMIDPDTYPDYLQCAMNVFSYMWENPSYNETYDSISIIMWDSWYNTRFMIPATALLYDWCYDSLSVAQRDSLSDALIMWADTMMYHKEISGSGGVWRMGEDDGYPTNNYFLGHMLALSMTGYALEDDFGRAAEYVDYAIDTMLAGAIRYTNREKFQMVYPGCTLDSLGIGNGSLWSEGTEYGCNDSEFLLEVLNAYLVKESTTATDAGIQFPSEYIMSMIYTLSPGDNIGDYSIVPMGESSSDGYLDDSHHMLHMIMAGHAIASDKADTTGYAYEWLQYYMGSTHTVSDYKKYMYAFFYDDLNDGADYSAIDDDWYGAGQRLATWRTAHLDSQAVHMEFRGGSTNEGHGSNIFGSYVIYAGNYLVSQYNIEKIAGDSYNKLSNFWYSGIYAKEDSSCHAGGSTCKDRFAASGLMEGGTTIARHYEAGADYSYLHADMTNPYVVLVSCNNWAGDDPVKVEHIESEWAVLKPDTVLVVLDRVDMDNIDYNVSQESYVKNFPRMFWHIWTHWACTGVDDEYSQNGANGFDLLIKRDYASEEMNFYATTVEGVNTLLDTMVTLNDTLVCMHSLKVTQDGGELSYLTGWSLDDGNVAYGGFRSGSNANHDYVYMFSTDLEGDDDTAFESGVIDISYTSPRDTTVVYLFDCAASTDYYWKTDTNIEIRTSHFSGCDTTTSTANGVLILNAEAGGETPETYDSDKPWGIGIRARSGLKGLTGPTLKR